MQHFEVRNELESRHCLCRLNHETPHLGEAEFLKQKLDSALVIPSSQSGDRLSPNVIVMIDQPCCKRITNCGRVLFR